MLESVISVRRNKKSARKCGKIVLETLEGKNDLSYSDTIKKYSVHNFTFDQHVGVLFEKNHGKSIKIKEKYLNFIDDTIAFTEKWKYMRKRERNAMIAIIDFLLIGE